MGSKPFTLIAAVLFGLAVLVHIYRLFMHFQIVIGSHDVSQTVSIIALVIAAVMSWGLYRESKR